MARDEETFARAYKSANGLNIRAESFTGNPDSMYPGLRPYESDYRGTDFGRGLTTGAELSASLSDTFVAQNNAEARTQRLIDESFAMAGGAFGQFGTGSVSVSEQDRQNALMTHFGEQPRPSAIERLADAYNALEIQPLVDLKQTVLDYNRNLMFDVDASSPFAGISLLSGLVRQEAIDFLMPTNAVEVVPLGALATKPVAKGLSSLVPNSVDSVAARRAYLNEKFDRTGDLNLDINIRGRQEVATNFFRSQGVPEGKVDSFFTGIDFTQPVEIQTIGSGKRLWQYQATGAPQGNWYSLSPSVEPTQLGISPYGFNRASQSVEPKVLNNYVTTEPVSVLRSSSAAVDDFWSVSGQSYPTTGGATQLFSPQKQSFILMPGN